MNLPYVVNSETVELISSIIILLTSGDSVDVSVIFELQRKKLEMRGNNEALKSTINSLKVCGGFVNRFYILLTTHKCDKHCILIHTNT